LFTQWYKRASVTKALGLFSKKPEMGMWQFRRRGSMSPRVHDALPQFPPQVFVKCAPLHPWMHSVFSGEEPWNNKIVGISLLFGSYPRTDSHPSACSSPTYFASYLSAHFGLMTTSSVVPLCSPLPSPFFNFLIPGGYPVFSLGFISDPGSVQQFTMNLFSPEITADIIFP